MKEPYTELTGLGSGRSVKEIKMSERFTDNGDGTITDNRTGLMWTKDAGTPTVGSCSGGIKNWQEALDYIACLNSINHLGYSDWKLPGVKELISLVDYSRFGPPLPLSHPFLNVQPHYYWSSSSYAYSTGYAWIVSMWNGYVSLDGKTSNYYVWPVR